MKPHEIITRIHFLSPVAWDGFRVELHKGRKLLLKGTQDLIYDQGVLFVLFTKIQEKLPFEEDDKEDYTRENMRIEVLESEPDLTLRLHYTRDRTMVFTCGRIYYAAMRAEPKDLAEVVDRCYALYDDYDYAHYFGVDTKLDAAEIHRLILGDEEYSKRMAR
jgi:hypothetical protein